MSYLKYRDGELYFGQQSLSKVSASYKGPTYVYNLGILRSRFQKMKNALPGVEIYYAMKANGNPTVLSELKKMGGRADVVSGGEIRAALKAGFTAKDIIYSGVGKTVAEIELALTEGIHQINSESFPELQRIVAVARRLKKKASVALRLNPNIEIKTHPYIATGLHENKFGIELDMLPELTAYFAANADAIELNGISLHLGSLMTELSGFRRALQLLKPVYKNLQSRFKSVQRFDVGGGLGIFYDRDALAEEEKLLVEYAAIVHEELKDVQGQIQTEPGRWLVAHAGLLLTQVQYVKKTPYRNFLIVDSGMNHLIRPALYESYHKIYPVIQKPGAPEAYDVVGPICESADFFAKGRELTACAADDFLVIADAGAYGFSMANTYNMHEFPREVCLNDE